MYQIFLQMPPLSIEELFGGQAAAAQPEPVKQEDEWEDIPDELMNEGFAGVHSIQPNMGR